MTTYISEQILKTTLSIPPNNIHNDLETLIYTQLCDKVEGTCSENGFIFKGSATILNRSMGKIVSYDNKSFMKFEVTYKAKIISPSDGDTMRVTVNNINKMGVISFIKLEEDNILSSEDSPLIVMIPQEYFENSPLNIEDITIGQTINVQILGSRTKFRSDKIQCVATPIDS
jgi:DNA-directed RNA polymerase subunit E'/Rpb7